MIGHQIKGVAPLRPENMTDADWAQLTGPTLSTTSTVTTASQLPSSGFSAGNAIDLSRMLWEIAPGATLHAMFQANHTQFFKALGVGHSNTSHIAGYRCSVNATLNDMILSTNNGGVLTGTGMSILQGRVNTQLDGIWPGDGLVTGVASRIESTWVSGPSSQSYYGYPLASNNIPVTVVGSAGTTGAYMSITQFNSVLTVAASTVYTAGQFISTVGGNLYQVSTGGTTGSGFISGSTTLYWWQAWTGGQSSTSSTRFCDLSSSDTSQPFSDGPDALKLVYIGPYMHDDGMQIPRAGTIDIYNCRIDNMNNSDIFIQSSGASYENNTSTYPQPAGPVRIVGCDLGYAGRWIYANCLGTDSVYNTGIYAGWWQRSTGGAWSAYASPWLGRPNYITITDNLFRDSAGGVMPSYSGATNTVEPLEMSSGGHTTYNGSSANLAQDYAVFVADENTRNTGIATQTNSDGSINSTVLEQRFQYGVFPGACDARSWIVWARNRDQRGAEIIPYLRGGQTGYDSKGYYTGI
jgi:hypothetical protein